MNESQRRNALDAQGPTFQDDHELRPVQVHTAMKVSDLLIQ